MKQFFISQKNLERPNTIIIGSNCKGGQKRQDLSTDISKRGDPPPPKLCWILSKVGGNNSFLGRNIAAGMKGFIPSRSQNGH